MLSRHAAYSMLDRVGDAEMANGSFTCGSTFQGADVGGQILEILAAPIKIRMLQAVVSCISNIFIKFHNLTTQLLRNERTMQYHYPYTRRTCQDVVGARYLAVFILRSRLPQNDFLKF
jgi:hypothetical protein